MISPENNPAGSPNGSHEPKACLPAALPPVLSATPNALALWKALRRRLLPAIIVAVICAAGIGTGIWYLVPPSQYTARTLLHVSANPPSIAFPNVEPRSDFLSYQRTQIALVKSRLVLGTALNQPNVASLSVVTDQVDPIEWLEREIKVDYSAGPEILRIAMNGDRPQELAILVNAVREAYLQKIVNRERTERLAKLAQLEEIYGKYQLTLEKKEQELRKLAKQVGSSESPTIAIKQHFTVEMLGMAQRELRKIQSDLRSLQVKVQDHQAKEQTAAGVEVPELLVEERLSKDPIVVQYQEELKKLQKEYEQAKTTAEGPLLQKYRNRLEAVQAKLDNIRKELRPTITEQLRDGARRRLHASAAESQDQVVLLTRLQDSLTDEIKRLEEQADSLSGSSLDVESFRRNLNQVEDITKKVGAQREALKLEIEAPSRVTVLEDAVIARTQNEKRQWMIAGGSALSVLGLVLFAFAWLEFHARRVSTVDEVVHGLGLKLVGAIPDVSRRGRRLLPASNASRNSYGSNSLTESVDAARTMLLHAARTDDLRIIMVTSAMGGEGKTSLASHLAASLARAGRRTLVLDADLRRPAVHRLFDVSIGPGFSELLRGEAEVIDAIQPTPINGLSLITAGHADGRALQALAQEELGTILQSLRQEFDFVVIDSCPVLPVVDPLLIGQHVDGVIFSVLREVSRIPKVYAAYQRLSTLGIPMLGAVVNGASGEVYGFDYSYPAPGA